jgi:hypothetical protein
MQLSLPISAGAVAIALLGGSFGALSTIISFIMIGKINEGVSETERISYFRWGTEVRKKFKRLHPESRLTFLLDLCVILMLVCFPALLWMWVFR